MSGLIGINFEVVMQIPAQVSKHLPDILPKLCKYHLKIMPNQLKIQCINIAMNHFFKEAITEGELDFLENKTFQINVDDIHYSTTITLRNNKLVALNANEKADVILKSTFNPLVLLISRKEDPDTLFFNRALAIEGNTALVLEIKNWLDSLDFDLLPKTMQRALINYSEML